MEDKRRKLFILLAAIVVTLIAVVAIAYFRPAKSPEGKQTTTNDQENSQNNQRNNDATSVASAIAEYGNDNLGAAPTEVSTSDTNNSAVTFCGDDCANQVKKEAKLAYYKPANISFHEKTAGLTVPNTETVYIVHQASCNENGDGLSSDTVSKRATAILYAISLESMPQQKCLST